MIKTKKTVKSSTIKKTRQKSANKLTARSVKKLNKKILPKRTRRSLTLLKLMPSVIVLAFAGYLQVQPSPPTSVNISNNSSAEVLAYATNTSRASLLTATNRERASYGAGALSIHSSLNTAAQNKANDMSARNYWSHQTPEGQDPWIFITNTGYQYLMAGENLAYGFDSSDLTVTGWMNSPSHKANLINNNYTEVGFGMANSANYQNTGPQTIVVAMYAKPQAGNPTSVTEPQPPVNSSNTQSAPKAEKPATKPSPAAQKPPKQTADNSQPVSESSENNNQAETEEQNLESNNAKASNNSELIAYDSSNPNRTNRSTEIKKVQMLTRGQAAWSATFVVVTVCVVGLLWASHRSYRLSKIIKDGRQIIGRYIYLDIFVLAIIALAFALMASSGRIL